MRPPTIYLAGPINGCSDGEANGWRQGFMAQLPTCGFLDPMRRDYRGKEDESVREIVEGDIKDIKDSDIFLANCWQVSWGTAIEIFFAKDYYDLIPARKVILVVPAGSRISPWLRHHSDHIVGTLTEAAELISSCYT